MKWISVKDKLPEKAGPYLVFHDDIGVGIALYLGGLWLADNNHYEFVTHWMPLPEPPK